ncbi:MAG: UDP-N-acetylmuramoyl-L-alanine--D-glutamate ligase [Bosea sp. (in: a-proteobacteria)]
MIPVTSFFRRRVALFGLGESGRHAAYALIAGGADVIAYDDEERKVGTASREGIPTMNLRALDWSKIDFFVLSPGVPLTHPQPHWSVRLARAANVPIIGDIELFAQERRKLAPTSPFIAITGTNGKSTTTALIAHILKSAGRDVQMGGNIGTPILELEPPALNRIHVVECSSFQIDLAPSLNPSIGIHLNLTPDHLDRHGNIESYAAIKERLVQAADMAIIGVDDDISAGFARRRRSLGRPLLSISAQGPVDQGVFAGVTAREGALETRLVRVEAMKPRIVADITRIGSLRGTHNAQNAAAGFAACASLGLSDAEIAAGMATYPGLPHRMEDIRHIGQVVFINDSKATNANSTEKALTSFGKIYWILGGKPKAGGIESLRRYFPNIAKAYLIGAATDEFAATLEGSVAFERCGTLDVAVAKAAADAASAPGANERAVLLSPACASYDQFANFEQRGEYFRTLVMALPG